MTSFILSTLITLNSLSLADSAEATGDQWFRGNIHTHSFWNGGRDFPENVAKWYKENGYNFLVFTEHDIVQKGEKWVQLPEDNSALARYLDHFGEEWVELMPDEQNESVVHVRTKPMDEYRSLFESNNEFLVLNGIEITDQHGVHFLAYHVDEIIPKVGGTSDERIKMIQKIVDRVDNYRERSGRNTWPILAHPNWNWNITAEMIKSAQNLRFFEVYNGVPEANNEGDEYRVDTDAIWDIVLSYRFDKPGGMPLYGLATDDAHDYDGGINGRNVGPGKGWVMVRSKKLTAESVLDALARGDFYSSTGVILNEIYFDGKTISIEIEPQAGETYTTNFIGTRKGFDTGSVPALDADGNEIKNTTRIYGEQIGGILKSSNKIMSDYTLQGDELYVRVLITSSANQTDPITREILGTQKAWVQPVFPEVN